MTMNSSLLGKMGTPSQLIMHYVDVCYLCNRTVSSHLANIHRYLHSCVNLWSIIRNISHTVYLHVNFFRYTWPYRCDFDERRCKIALGNFHCAATFEMSAILGWRKASAVPDVLCLDVGLADSGSAAAFKMWTHGRHVAKSQMLVKTKLK